MSTTCHFTCGQRDLREPPYIWAVGPLSALAHSSCLPTWDRTLGGAAAGQTLAQCHQQLGGDSGARRTTPAVRCRNSCDVLCSRAVHDQRPSGVTLSAWNPTNPHSWRTALVWTSTARTQARPPVHLPCAKTPSPGSVPLPTSQSLAPCVCSPVRSVQQSQHRAWTLCTPLLTDREHTWYGSSHRQACSEPQHATSPGCRSAKPE